METNLYAASVKDWRGWLKGYRVKNYLVKIGHTGGDVENYVRNLKNQYGAEFLLLRAVRVSPKAETLLHRVFRSQRVLIGNTSTDRVNREFFDLQEEQLKAAFDLLVLLGAREIRSGLPALAPKSKPVRQLRKRSDIPMGAELHGTYLERRYTCVVETPGRTPRVKYRNRRGLSLSEAARLVTKYGNMSGTDFWSYEGIKISDLERA